MINVNQITADLARMPDKALQQYAQMHRNDPYIVALALSESNRRRQLRTGAQAGAVQQQPSVVEQDIAQMAPEEVGIGSLPERSLTSMAAGGIVAFEEGGEVERYQNTGYTGSDYYDDPHYAGILDTPTSPFYRGFISTGRQVKGYLDESAKLAHLRRMVNEKYGMSGALPGLFMKQTPEERKRAQDISENIYRMSADELEALLTPPQKNIKSQGQLRALDTGNRAPATQSASDVYRDHAIAASQEADAGMYPAARPSIAATTAATTAAPSPAMTALQALAAGQNAPGGGVPRSSVPRSGVDNLVQTPEQYKDMLDKFRPNSATIVDPFAKQAEEAGAARIAASEAERDQFKKDIADLGEFGAEREKRLKAREEKLGKQEGELGGLALLKAGFAMMSGTSPHAFTNIGAGAGIGIEEYTKGKEKIDAARERLDDAYAKLDEVRRGEKVANARELRGLEKNVKLAEADVKDKGVAALRSQLGIEEDKAKSMAEAYVADRRAQAQMGSAERIAEAQMGSAERIAAMNRQSQAATALAQIEAHERLAQLPGAEQRLYMALGEGDVLKGFERAKTIMQETKKDLMTEFNEWKKANPLIMDNDEAVQKFLKQKMMFSGLGGLNANKMGFTNPGSDATVLKPKQ